MCMCHTLYACMCVGNVHIGMQLLSHVAALKRLNVRVEPLRAR